MSFASEVKDELLNVKTNKPCCKTAEEYGILLFSKTFSASKIVITTESAGVALRVKNIFASVSGGADVFQRRSENRKKVYTISAKSRGSKQIIDRFGHMPPEKSETGIYGRVALRINRANIENECCAGAFLRGVFLSCGTVSDPQKEYHLEFFVSHRRLAKDLCDLLNELGIQARMTLRKSAAIIYLKESESIEDFLTLTEAVEASLSIMNTKIYKDFRNLTNRRVNCETANITKTVNAAGTQILAIEKLMKSKKINVLSKELKTIAVLRYENPEMSLRELAQLCKMSRSGINHRLNKLIEISEK